jgi:hypothetical protein
MSNHVERMTQALRAIAQSDDSEGGCYYTNRGNIRAAEKALKDCGIPIYPPKGEDNPK